MSPKMKNFIVRAITGALFVAIMVAGLLDPTAMIGLFALITGLALWEYTGLVNNIENVCINRFISTVAGVYLFVAIAGINSGIIQTNAVFVPYLLTVVYLFISELYTVNCAWHILFLTLTCGVIAAGVMQGIERLSKYLLPTLFVLMIFLIARSLTLPGAMP